jgi:hypothetical protein
VLINARVQVAAEALRALVAQAVRTTLSDAGIAYQSTGATAFAPQVPGKCCDEKGLSWRIP